MKLTRRNERTRVLVPTRGFEDVVVYENRGPYSNVGFRV